MRAKLLILFLILNYTAQAQAQSDKITIAFIDTELENILDSLSKSTGYFFSYNSDLLPKGSKYTITAVNQPIDQFLSRLLIGTNLKTSFYKDQIILNYEEPQKQPVRKRDFFSVSGKVLDEDGKPKGNVSVFIDGTTIGTSTDIDGNYKLESIPPGYYDIVFSHVGYQNSAYHVSEYHGMPRMQEHQMQIDLAQLEEVEVVSNRIRPNNSGWQGYYKVFQEELLGTSNNAKECVIENPEVINFYYDESTETLTSYTSEPLIIRNDALGYRVNYLLESFRRSSRDLRYRGRMEFRNLTPVTRAERRVWKNGRKKSYNGSFNHFKKALLQKELKKEGFWIYEVESLDNLKLRRSNELTEDDILSFRGDHYLLDFDDFLLVEYRKETESVDFLTNASDVGLFYANNIADSVITKTPSHQLSILRLLKANARMDMTGQILNRFAITTYGYWSWERLGDLVPVNYNAKWDNL